MKARAQGQNRLLQRTWRRVLLAAGMLLIGCLPAFSAKAEKLSLSAYLEQVKAGNAEYNSARLNYAAASTKLSEQHLLTSPWIFASYRQVEDHSLSLDALYYGDARFQNQYVLGYEQQTAWGLNVRLTHQTGYSAFSGLNPLYVPLPEFSDHFYTSQTSLNLTQDLWRNAFGGEVRTGQQALAAKYRALMAEHAFQMKQITTLAESAYRRLSLLRETAGVVEDLQKRAGQLLAWTQSQARLKLLDRADVMQSESQLKALGLERAAVQDEEQAAGRKFNLLRGQNTASVAEILELPEAASIPIPALQETAPERQDLLALRESRVAAGLQAGLASEGLKPELQVVVTLAGNGLDPEFLPAFGASYQTLYPTYMAGLNLRLPLDLGTRRKLESAYAEEADGWEQLLTQRTLQSEALWQELRRRLQTLQARLLAAQELEKLQKEKSDYERLRLRRGNTITLQVMQFEQDWGRSRLTRLEIEGAILELLAQLKLFQD